MNTTAKKVDLLKSKMWSPNPSLARFYFERDYIQCVLAKNGKVYYKAVGFEIENTDEVVSQISFFMKGVEINEIFPSKF